MLHRIGIRDKNKILANQNNIIEPIELAKFIDKNKKKGWLFISINELIHELKNKRVPKKTITLTFDDGYIDNYTEAYPILKSYNCPFCIYITTGFLEKKKIPWWYKLESIILNLKNITSPENKYYHLKKMKDKNLAFLDIRKNLMTNKESYDSFNKWIDINYKRNLNNYNYRLFMNWEEILNLSKDKLVTIGAHTKSHPVLSHLTHESAHKEIEEAQKILQYKINQEINHFAYPFGEEKDFSFKDIDILKQLGFKSAVSTRSDYLKLEKNLLYNLPRVFFGPNFSLIKKQAKFLIRSYIKKII